MDKILFKAVRVDNMKWVSGSYANCRHPAWKPHETGHFIIKYPDEYHEIYTSTICQYIGYKDCTGKDVFEHDIVSYADSDGNEHKGEVVFCGGCYEIKWVKDHDLRNDVYFWFTRRHVKVIGNKIFSFD